MIEREQLARAAKAKIELQKRMAKRDELFVDEFYTAPQDVNLDMLIELYLNLFRKAFSAEDFKTSEKVLSSLEKLILHKQSKDSKAEKN